MTNVRYVGKSICTLLHYTLKKEAPLHIEHLRDPNTRGTHEAIFKRYNTSTASHIYIKQVVYE